MNKFTKYLSIFLISAFLFQFEISAKVHVITHCFNRPEFIIWQAKTFNKFLLDEYEFIVCDDTPTTRLSLQTQNICRELGIKCIRIPQSIHKGRNAPSEACSDSVQYTLNSFGFDLPGIVAIVDSDMFLIREFSFNEYLADNDIAALPQYRNGRNELVCYFLPNLLIFNMDTFPNKRSLNFNLGAIDGVQTDAAGFTHFYIKDNPLLKWKHSNVFYVVNEGNSAISDDIIQSFKRYPKLWDLMTSQKFDYEFYNDVSFFHFRAGSNWNKIENNVMEEKTRLLSEAIEELLN